MGTLNALYEILQYPKEYIILTGNPLIFQMLSDGRRLVLFLLTNNGKIN